MATPLGDALRLAMERVDPDRVLPCLLVAGYAYYMRDETLMDDELFDEGCKFLVKHWRAITHPHKSCVTLGDLKAGTLYALTAYPTITRHSACVLIRALKNNETHHLQGLVANPERLSGRTPRVAHLDGRDQKAETQADCNLSLF